MLFFHLHSEHPLFVNFSSKKGGGFGGMFGMLKGLVGSKSLTREDMEPVLDKMRDHLIGMISHLFLILTLLIFCNIYKCIVWDLFSLLNDPPAKNVAADIASQLCDSVAKKLEGKVMGTFTSK